MCQRLLKISQGSRSVADYSVEFRTLAAEAGWDEGALRSIFVQGLNDHLQDSFRDDLASLNALVSLNIRLDNWLRERQQSRSRPLSARTPPPAPLLLPFYPSASKPGTHHEGHEPMQLGRARLTPEERECRMREGRCLYCREREHLLKDCPGQPKGASSPIGPRLLVRCQVFSKLNLHKAYHLV